MNKSVRVLNYLPSGDPVGGEEILASNIANLWLKYDVYQIVLYPHSGVMWPRFSSSGICLIDFAIRSKWDYSALDRLSKIVQDYNVDIIHTHGPSLGEVFVSIIASRANIRWVATRPNIQSLLFGRPFYLRFAYRVIDTLSLRNANVVCLADRGVQQVREMSYVKKEKISLIYNGVDIDKFKPRQYYSNNEKYVINIVMTGALNPIKGWYDFITVVNALRKYDVRVKAYIVGDGPLYFDLKEKIEAMRLTEVISMLGWVDTVEVILSQMDIFLFTSYSEGMPVAILEAMASGLPVVSTDVGGVREQIVEAQNGYILQPGDVQGMTEKCIQLIDSPALMKKMGFESRKRAMTFFSQDIMVSSYSKLFHSLKLE